jgi:hypothetical protein
VSCSSLNCTVVGCASGVQIDLLSLPLLPGDASVITVCVEKECQETRPESSPLQFVQASSRIKKETAVVVTVTMTGPDGTTLVADSITTDLVKNEPNGPKCGPTCYSGRLRVTSAGKLATV